ncbi:unnamed protein product [Sphagnum tenellum]
MRRWKCLYHSHRPKALNALTKDMLTRLAELSQELDQRPAVKVIILTGAAFSAGVPKVIAKAILKNQERMMLEYKAIINDGFRLPFGEALKLEQEGAHTYYAGMKPEDFAAMQRLHCWSLCQASKAYLQALRFSKLLFSLPRVDPMLEA